jgi:hypothetical protein
MEVFKQYSNHIMWLGILMFGIVVPVVNSQTLLASIALPAKS